MEMDEKIKSNIELISKAIKRHSVVSFFYADMGQIVVEPIVLGILKETGKHVLRCYKSFPPHINDSKDNWYLCDLENISSVKLVPARSKNFRKGSKTIDGDMAEVIVASADYLRR